MTYTNLFDAEQAIKKLIKEQQRLRALDTQDVLEKVEQHRRISEIDQELQVIALATKEMRDRREKEMEVRVKTVAEERDQAIDKLLELMVDFTEQAQTLKPLGEQFKQMVDLAGRIRGADNFIEKHRVAGVHAANLFLLEESELNRWLRRHVAQAFGLPPFLGLNLTERMGLEQYDLAAETERVVNLVIASRKRSGGGQ